MPRFRKKPVVIEAYHMTWANAFGGKADWPGWLLRAWWAPKGAVGSIWKDPDDEEGKALVCGTLEGVMRIDWNDWIIQGVKGEIYPCKPDIFQMTYEALPTEDNDGGHDSDPGQG